MIHFQVDPVLLEPARAAIDSILKSQRLLSLATVDDGNEPYASTAYFAVEEESLDIIVFSEPSKSHSKFIDRNGKFAATIFDSNQAGSPLQGLQILGDAWITGDDDRAQAFAAYALRYSWLAAAASTADEALEKFQSRFYRLRPSHFRVFDETRFDAEQIVDVAVTRPE